MERLLAAGLLRQQPQPLLELTLSRGTSVELYGLRICRQSAENGKIKYALVLSDGTKTSGMVLTE